jgi:hypothetical protein
VAGVGILATSVACGSDDPDTGDRDATTMIGAATADTDDATEDTGPPAVTPTTPLTSRIVAGTATTAPVTSTTTSASAATTSVPPVNSTSIRVIITLDADRSVTEMADLLRSHFGLDLEVEAELPAIGQVIATIHPDRRAELAAYDGVAAVHDDRPDPPAN